MLLDKILIIAWGYFIYEKTKTSNYAHSIRKKNY